MINRCMGFSADIVMVECQVVIVEKKTNVLRLQDRADLKLKISWLCWLVPQLRMGRIPRPDVLGCHDPGNTPSSALKTIHKSARLCYLVLDWRSTTCAW